MKKVVIISLLAQILWGSDDYLPVSKLTDEKKYEYGFLNKENQKEIVKAKNNINDDGYEPIKEIKVDLQEEIKVEKTELPKRVVEEKKLEIKEKDYKKETVNKEFVADYKKENILKDSKVKNESSFASDFSVTPKFNYAYLKSDFYATDRVSVVDEKAVLVPELSISYKNHTLKAEGFETKSYFNKVLVGGSDLETVAKWYKLYYLHSFNNLNYGVAYNKFNLDFFAVNNNNRYEDTEEFPSLELHMKNSNDILQAEYGFSYGKNNNLAYSYEYYITLGYKILRDDLVLSAGYKNKTIEYNFPERAVDYKYEFEGPMIGLSGTF